jgi:hypothetical protein
VTFWGIPLFVQSLKWHPALKGSHEGKHFALPTKQIEYFGASHVLHVSSQKKKVQNQEAHPSMTGFLSRCHQRPGQVSLRPQLAQLAQLALAALEPLPLVVWAHLT